MWSREEYIASAEEAGWPVTGKRGKNWPRNKTIMIYNVSNELKQKEQISVH
jgi:hypothetical protein